MKSRRRTSGMSNKDLLNSPAGCAISGLSVYITKVPTKMQYNLSCQHINLQDLLHCDLFNDNGF